MQRSVREGKGRGRRVGRKGVGVCIYIYTVSEIDPRVDEKANYLTN